MRSFKYKKLKPDRSELEQAGINFLQRSVTGKYVPGQKEGKETIDIGKKLDTKDQTMLTLFNSGGPQTHHSNHSNHSNHVLARSCQVAAMQKELEELQPQLVETAAENLKMMKVCKLINDAVDLVLVCNFAT